MSYDNGDTKMPIPPESMNDEPRMSMGGQMFEGSRARSASTWTTRSALVETSRPIYHTRTVRDNYLKMEAAKKSFKDNVQSSLRDACRCNASKVKKAALSIFPFVNIMRKYDLRTDLINDIIAGLTVGIMQLPQGMAYSMLADLPAVVGLYMSFFPVIIYFFFATSKQISMGTVAVVSLMTGGIVAAQTQLWLPEYGESIGENNFTSRFEIDDLSDKERKDIDAFKIGIACSISFITGLAQIGMGLCKVGFVTTYMGDSLVSGFTTGAAVHVFTSQVKYVFGLKIQRFPNTFQIIRTYHAIIMKLPETNIANLTLAAICMVIIYIVKVHINMRYKTKMKMPVPIELIIVVSATLASYYGDFHARWAIKVVGKIPAGVPQPALPSFHNVGSYGFDCVIVGVVAFAQSVSLAVLMAKKHHYAIDSNKEMIGYGAGTLFGSFFSCYPIAASVSRSSVQDSAGGRTQVVTLVSACMVLVVILFIGPLFESLPNCALSAIIMVSLRSLFLQVLELKTLFRVSPYDGLIWIVTFTCVVVLHVDMGLVIGIVFAFFTVVCRSQTTKVTTVEKLNDIDEYRSVALYAKTEPNVRIRIVAYNSALYYANSELFLKHVYKETGVKPEKMRKVLKKMMTLNDPMHVNKKKFASSKIVEMETVTPRPVENGDHLAPGGDMMAHRGSIIGPMPGLDPRPFLYLIIDCSAFTFIDPTGIKIIKQLIEDYKTVGITTYLAGIRDDAWYTMEQSGFTKTYERTCFLTVRDAVFAAEEDKVKKAHPLPEQFRNQNTKM